MICWFNVKKVLAPPKASVYQLLNGNPLLCFYRALVSQVGYGSFKWWVQHLEAYNQYNVRNIQRNIFQTFWKQDSCPDFLFIQLETLNFGVLMVSKKIKRGTNIKFVQTSSNFVQFRKIKKVTTSQNLTQKTKKSGQLSCFQKVWKILLLKWIIKYYTFGICQTEKADKK